MTKEYVIKTTFGTQGNVYYQDTTRIGPRFTKDIDEAHKFENKEDALYVQGTHFGFIGSKIEEYED